MTDFQFTFTFRRVPLPTNFIDFSEFEKFPIRKPFSFTLLRQNQFLSENAPTEDAWNGRPS
jgi:hypothetical protein